MGDRFGFRLAIGIVALAAVAAVGVYTYNLGLAHGIAESGRAIAVPGGGVPVVAVWPRPWGFGFGFFPFFPLFFILFWVVVLRGMFWRRGWRGRGYGYDGVPPAFDEWHRRAHEKEAKS
jgi:hypothetical protein